MQGKRIKNKNASKIIELCKFLIFLKKKKSYKNEEVTNFNAFALE
jgi:hypothetical protein